jgi:acetyltransferase
MSGDGGRAWPHRLDALFSPRSVAVIGASERPHSVGRIVFSNLTDGSFGGAVFPVTPAHASVLGRAAFADIGAVPRPVDLAIVATPAASVPSIIAQCAAAGVSTAIILSAGFRETGTAGVELERRIAQSAGSTGLRILGPNCLGLMSPGNGLNASFAGESALPGSVGFVSQSGALCTAVLDWSLGERVGFSAFVSVGSMLDIGWADLIYYLGDDPACKSIVLYMESVGDARTFMSAAREVAQSKPIVVMKAGRTAVAAHAAVSHTGALAGSDDVIDAALRRCGVLRVDALEDLFQMADVLSKQPRPRGKRLAIVTNAGGAGVIAADALIRGGGETATLSAASMAALDAVLPPSWSKGDPIDMLGDADPARYEHTLEIVAADEGVDGLLVALAPQGVADAADVAARVAIHARQDRKPVLAAWMGGPGVSAGAGVLRDAGVPVFTYPDTAARVFNDMWRSEANLRALFETPAPTTELDEASRRAVAAQVIAGAQSRGRIVLTEAEAKRILAAYGIPTVQTVSASNIADAILAAKRIGYPVVVKLNSETITHKSEVGGVRLDVADAGGVESAYREIESSVLEAKGPGNFSGVSVEPMIHRRGLELILGSAVDAQFGPTLLFGTGGTLAEVLADSAVELPPLTTTLARQLMERTKIYRALKGIRGEAPADLAALETTLVRFGTLVMEQPRIREIEMNPLLAGSGGVLALDARAILHPAQVRDDELPRPAIRAYPAQYAGECVLRDGARLQVRPIRPDDEPMMREFHGALSKQSVYYRYAGIVSLDQRIVHENLSRMCFIDYARQIALIAIAGSTIVAVARLIRAHDADEAEFALIVTDVYQRRGLGTELMRRLLAIARAERIGAVVGYILNENLGMQRICSTLGFTLEPGDGKDLVRAVYRVIPDL